MKDAKTKDLISVFVLILIFAGLILGLMWKISKLEQKIQEYKNAPADTVTIEKIDTLIVNNPVPVYKYISKTEVVTVNDSLFIHDTTEKLVFLPREYMVYKDSSYRAVVSGVEPRLDSIEIYQKTITNTITKYVPQKIKTFSPYIEAGVSVNTKDNKEMMGDIGLGVMIKKKVGVSANLQHNFQTKQDYIGGKILYTF